jgi:hypothetical protein
MSLRIIPYIIYKINQSHQSQSYRKYFYNGFVIDTTKLRSRVRI